MRVSDSYEDIEMQARALMEGGRSTEALAQYQRLAQRLEALRPVVLDRRPELRKLLVLCLAQQARILHWEDNLEQARDLYSRLMDMDPDNQAVWHEGAALVRIDMGEVEAGLDELRALGVASPGDPAVWLTIAKECEALGRYDEAEENYARAIKNASSSKLRNHVLLSLFDYHRARGDVDKAMQAWNEAWEDKDGQPDYIFPIYQMMWENGDVEQALEYLEKETNPLRQGFYRGWFAFERNDTDAALRHWRKVVKMKSWQYEEGHDAWAEAALRTNTPPEEVVSLLHAVQKANAMTIRGLILLAVAESRLGHTDQAVAALTTARNIGAHSRPREESLSFSNYQLVDELLSDEAAKSPLRHLFNTEQA